jgi:protein TonB
MFEHSLIDLEEKQHPRRRWAPLPIAIGLHAVVLTSVALAQVWNVAAVAEPDRAMGPYVTVLLPPPPPPAAGGQRQKTSTSAPTPRQSVQQPDADRIPDTPPTDPVPMPGPVEEDGPCCGAENGVIGGITGGDPNSDLSTGGGGIGFDGPIAPPEPRNEIVRFDGSMSRPVMLSGRQPRYTELARRAGTQGVVILEAVIDKQGHVTNVRVLKSLGMGLDDEAMAAVREWTFEPAKIGNRPVAVYYTLTVNFQIQR